MNSSHLDRGAAHHGGQADRLVFGRFPGVSIAPPGRLRMVVIKQSRFNFAPWKFRGKFKLTLGAGGLKAVEEQLDPSFKFLSRFLSEGDGDETLWSPFDQHGHNIL